MKYTIKHISNYDYSRNVSHSYNQTYLKPRITQLQTCTDHRLSISPHSADFSTRVDVYGNELAYFEIREPHNHFEVVSVSTVNVKQVAYRDSLIDTGIQVHQAQLLMHDAGDEQLRMSQEFLLDSDFVKRSNEVHQFSKASLKGNRPLRLAVSDLMEKIYSEFDYDPHFTTTATPLKTVLEHKRGVCQDFAHLAIACLRSHGLAARYVSGYLETKPPPGKQKLVGSDASHAWFSVLIPGEGWLDFDPTNNCVPSGQHITLAWGRDYFDVTPLKGVLFGGGNHSVSVSVDVQRIS